MSSTKKGFDSMADDKKSTSGAPSNDTTSALFVSARKKQLEQQEAERRAKEKEDARLTAEAEVRRLELEVEERRRRAEESARMAEAEAKQSEAEARKKREQAALELPPGLIGGQARPEAGPKSKLSGKMIAIVGGVAVAVIALVLVLVLRGGGEPYLTSNGIDIRGLYYSNNSNAEINFLEDGSLEFEGGEDGTQRGTYSIKGDTVTIEVSGAKLDLTALNAETLTDASGGRFTRTLPKEPEPAAAAAPSWTLDPNAPIDTVVTLDELKLGYTFPSTQFTAKEKTDTSAEIWSKDDRSIITIRSLSNYGKQSVPGADIPPVKDLLIKSFNESIPGGITVTENQVKSTSSALSYFKATYEQEGEKRYIYAGFSGWKNIKTNTNYLFSVTMFCPLDQAAEYQLLYDRLWVEIMDRD
jgi:hypothetical protein